MKTPEFLKKGDLVSIIAPSGKIDVKKVINAKKHLENIGLIVEIGENINKNFYQFSATEDLRILDFQKSLNNKNIKAIFCARGGYGAVQIIDKLDFTKFNKNPKWIIGYSDITVFHSYLNKKLEICSIHGTMPVNYSNFPLTSQSFEYLTKLTFGERLEYKIKSSKYNIYGQAKGEIVGGNLTILYSLRGTPYDINTDNKILLIEDVSEYLYNIDRIMYNLKIGGKLKNLKALIVGGFTDLKDNEQPFGKTIYDIILSAVNEYNYPVIFNFPVGHQKENFAIKLGCVASISSNNKETIFKQL